MGDLTFLAAGHAVFWILTFVLVYSMVSRQRNLQKDLKMLEQLAQRETDVE